MLDPLYVRENIDKLKDLIFTQGRGNSEHTDLDKWLELDSKRKELIIKRDELNSRKNQLAEEGRKGNIEVVKVEGKKLREEGDILEKELKEVESEWNTILSWLPNVPLEEVPTGKSEAENVETKAWTEETGYFEADKLGESGKYMPSFAVKSSKDFKVVPHWEIGTKLGMIDLEAGSKVSGSRFYYIKGNGVLLINAVFQLLFKKLIQEKFEPMIVPILVKGKALFGSGHFPGDEDQVYKLESKYIEDDAGGLYLLGSSEPSNFSYFSDKTLDLTTPIKIMAQTPCFRSEVGSWGKDVRGIKRTHQFDKLEMNIVMEADLDKAREQQEYLLSLNEWLLQELKLPYRVINMCYGDLGYFAAAKKYDVEVWLPSQMEYMEVMSNSITTDFQSRRLNIKYKDSDGKSRYAYTLNDTGATHRLLIAIIEHYQQADGSIKVPEALIPFVGKDIIS